VFYVVLECLIISMDMGAGKIISMLRLSIEKTALCVMITACTGAVE